MKNNLSIITIGLCPSWDIVCQVEGINWGQHKVASSCISRPAGKAFNISQALFWMGEKSIAAGLWGQQDYKNMQQAVARGKKFISIKMTAATGATRRNITIIDTVKSREMHLRSKSELVSKESLKRLKADLEKMVGKDRICVFAGSMPGKQLIRDFAVIMDTCHKNGAKLVLDTSGILYRQVVDAGRVWMIKPNIEELCQLIGEEVKDTTDSIVKAGRKLLGKVEMVLVSRGKNGAIIITQKGVWQGRFTGTDRKILSTVGCGDYLLAGFLKGWKDKPNTNYALKTAIKVATAKACGWTEQMNWTQVQRQIKVEIKKIR